MEYTKQLLYTKFERFWHWSQMLLVMLLTITGFEIHGSIHLFGFERSVRLHTASAWSFIGLALMSIFWMIVTKQYVNFIPTKNKLREQVLYYTSGIFKGMAHPTHKTMFNKLNPLQRLVYAGLLIVIFPVQIFTGLAYMYYHYPQNPLDISGLNIAAVLHTAGAFMVVAFVIIHVYMTTTGDTVSSNVKAMISGFEKEPQNNNETSSISE